MPKKITDLAVGGQAVIEGVMMRDANKTATAVRLPNGEIEVETHPVTSIRERYPVLNLPLIRGSVIMVESLVIGMRALSFSAQAAGEEDEQMTKQEIAMTILFALVLASVLFIVIPTGAAHLAAAYTDDPVVFNLIEGGIRLLVFLLYIWGISFMGGIRRVFQYHGAEHKTIHCYEAGGGSDGRERAEVSASASALRNQLPADCHGRRHCLSRLFRLAGSLAADSEPSRRPARSRGCLLRDHPLCGAQREPHCAHHDYAGAVAAISDDAPARR